MARTPTKSIIKINYFQTINQFTMLDAYPLPKIEDLVNKVSQDQCYSSVDLQLAYHQVPLLENERPYTAFETIGRMYQHKRLSFKVTNGSAVFQKVINGFIQRNQLSGKVIPDPSRLQPLLDVPPPTNPKEINTRKTEILNYP